MEGNGIFKDPLVAKKYCADQDQLLEKLNQLRRNNIDQIVFTGGVWDLIHPGHLFYLRKAREEGHYLVVGVDTDELAGKRKKKNEINRPIIGFEERVLVLAFLGIVDLIIPVTDDILPIVQKIRPEALVVSTTTGDLPPDKYDSYKPYVGRIVPLPPQAPPELVSSTARIRKTVVEGLDIAHRELRKAVDETFIRLRQEVV